MRALTAAYGVLGDPRLRWEYDTRRGYAEPVFAPWRGSGMRATYARGGTGGIPRDGVWSRGGIAKEETGGDPNGAGWFVGMLGLIPLPRLADCDSPNRRRTRIARWYRGRRSCSARWPSGPSRRARHPRGWPPNGWRAIPHRALGRAGRATTSPRRPLPRRGHQPARHPVLRVGRREAGGGGEDAEPSAASTPPTLDADTFDRLVAEALAAVPPEFAPYMANIVVEVRPEPTAEERRILDVREGGLLLGLYRGVSLSRRGVGASRPRRSRSSRGRSERYCGGDAARIREQVRRTVLHELAHHFGIDHDQMPDWIRYTLDPPTRVVAAASDACRAGRMRRPGTRCATEVYLSISRVDHRRARTHQAHRRDRRSSGSAPPVSHDRRGASVRRARYPPRKRSGPGRQCGVSGRRPLVHGVLAAPVDGGPGLHGAQQCGHAIHLARRGKLARQVVHDDEAHVVGRDIEGPAGRPEPRGIERRRLTGECQRLEDVGGVDAPRLTACVVGLVEHPHHLRRAERDIAGPGVGQHVRRRCPGRRRVSPRSHPRVW